MTAVPVVQPVHSQLKHSAPPFKPASQLIVSPTTVQVCTINAHFTLLVHAAIDQLNFVFVFGTENDNLVIYDGFSHFYCWPKAIFRCQFRFCCTITMKTPKTKLTKLN